MCHVSQICLLGVNIHEGLLFFRFLAPIGKLPEHVNPGDLVVLKNNIDFIKAEFDDLPNPFEWNDAMLPMLGQKFYVLDNLYSDDTHIACYDDNILALPSPDGSNEGKWFFSQDMVRLVKKFGKLQHFPIT